MTLYFSRRLRAALTLVCAIMAAGPATAQETVDLLASDALADTWRGYQKDSTPEGWSLEEGVLAHAGGGGNLVTREQFTDFDLRFEWKIAPGGNSGVLYRVSEETSQPYETGPEYQVLDPAYPNVNELTGPAALYGLYPAPKGASKPAGEWNTGRIVVDNGRVEHWINGQRVVSAQIGSEQWNGLVAGSKFSAWPGFGKNASGHLALQDHDSPVWYRNLSVKRLNEAAE